MEKIDKSLIATYRSAVVNIALEKTRLRDENSQLQTDIAALKKELERLKPQTQPDPFTSTQQLDGLLAGVARKD